MCATPYSVTMEQLVSVKLISKVNTVVLMVALDSIACTDKLQTAAQYNIYYLFDIRRLPCNDYNLTRPSYLYKLYLYTISCRSHFNKPINLSSNGSSDIKL